MSDKRNSMTKKIAGYMTVEASLLMPFVLLCLCGVLWLGFLQYDRALIRAVCDRVCIKCSSDLFSSVRKKEHRLEEALLKAKELPGCDVISWEKSIQEDAVFLSYTGQIPTFIDRFGGDRSYSVLSFAGTQRIETHDPEAFVRNCRKVEKQFGD